MTPVAGGVADAYQKRQVFLFGDFKRFIALRVPVNRTMSWLQKVGTFLVDTPFCLSVYNHYSSVQDKGFLGRGFQIAPAME